MLELSIELLSRSSFMCVVTHLGSTCALLGHGELGKDFRQMNEPQELLFIPYRLGYMKIFFCCVSLAGGGGGMLYVLLDIFSLGGFK